MNEFEYGDKVMWTDRNGNPYMGTYHHKINEHRSMVMVDAGVAETRLTTSLTKVTPLLELAGQGEPEEQPTFEFKEGDPVEWLDSEGNLCDGEFRFPYIYNQKCGIVWRDEGYVTQVPIEDLRPASEESEPEPEPLPEFKKGDIVTWRDSDGEEQFGTYYRIFKGGFGEVMTEPGYYQDVPLESLKLAPKPKLQKGDRVTWLKEDGMRREGEFCHETSTGTGYVVMSRTISSYVPMHKLQKIDPSAS